jgi:methyl-accepting chemotaxis protein
MTIRRLIFLLVITTSLIPILALGTFSTYESQKSLEEEILKENELFINMSSQYYDAKFDSLIREIELLAKDSTFIEVIRLEQQIEALGGSVTFTETDPIVTIPEQTITIEPGEEGEEAQVVPDVITPQMMENRFKQLYNQARESIKDTTANSEDIWDMLITDHNDDIAYYTVETANGVNVAHRQYLQDARNGQTNFDEMFFSDIVFKINLVLAAPIYDDGEYLGIVLFVLNPYSVIDDTIHNNLPFLGDTANSYLVDAEGLLHSNTFKGDYMEEGNLFESIDSEMVTALSSDIANANYGESYTLEYKDYMGDDVIGTGMVVALGEEPVGLIIEKETSEAYASVNNLKLLLYIADAAVIILAFVLAFFIGKAILSPIKKVTVVAEKVSNGNTDVSLDQIKKRKDDVGKLAKAFDKVISSNKKKAELISYIADGDFDKVEVDKNSNDIVFDSINQVKENLTSFSNEVKSSANEINAGHFDTEIASSNFTGMYEELILDVNMLITGFASRFNESNTPIFIVDKTGKIVFANNVFGSLIGQSKQQVEQSNYQDVINLVDGSTVNIVSKAYQMNQDVTEDLTIDVKGKTVYLTVTASPYSSNGEVIGCYLSAYDKTLEEEQAIVSKVRADYQREHVQVLLDNINKLAEGNFNMIFDDPDFDENTEDLQKIFVALNAGLEKAVTSTGGYINEISTVLDSLSKSDLDVSVTRDYVGDFENIKVALNSIIDSFNDVVKNIYNTSNDVTFGAKSMSESSQILSQGATEQAASLEEISATVTQVAAQVQENAKNAQFVNENAQNAATNAEQSNHLMEQLSSAMKEVQKSTQSIQKVLKMINDIAFQTNILSLNAAVEAARAGQHGKGFAVIAEDVRNLALKSASAADETTDMLDSIVAQISESVAIAEETEKSLEAIVTGASRNVQVSSEVATASNEQAVAIGQITLSLDQISQVVQTTSVNAQKGASTSDELTMLSNELMKIVTSFNMKDFEVEYKAVELQSKKVEEESNDEPIIDLDGFDF